MELKNKLCEFYISYWVYLTRAETWLHIDYAQMGVGGDDIVVTTCAQRISVE